jgi:hypothetical protein
MIIQKINIINSCGTSFNPDQTSFNFIKWLKNYFILTCKSLILHFCFSSSSVAKSLDHLGKHSREPNISWSIYTPLVSAYGFSEEMRRHLQKKKCSSQHSWMHSLVSTLFYIKGQRLDVKLITSWIAKQIQDVARHERAWRIVFLVYPFTKLK